MIAALLLVISFYIAIRLTLSEASQRLNRLRGLWSQKKVEPPEVNEDKLVTTKISTMPRRKSGAINGRTAFKTPDVKKFTRSQLRLPFMDTGSWFRKDENTENIQDLQSLDAKNTESKRRTSISYPTNESIFNMFKVPTQERGSNILTRMFHHVSLIIHRDSSTHYSDVSDKVLSSDRVKTAIKTSVMEDLKGQDADYPLILASQLTHKQRALHVVHQMKSCISSFLLKIAAWVMYKLLGKMLDGIEVHRDQIDTIKNASKKNVPIIYLPLHRSHLDYILVTFILYMNDLRAPLVAAGNNLMIPFFGSLLRGLGAFFIKRKLDAQNGQRDFVYRAVLHTYMEESLREGHSLEFFIEGGRSRTGKAVLPKAGLLSIVVDTLVSGGITDAYIVPIAMSYEKLLDGNFISEQLGKPKEMESFTTAIQAIWRTLHSNFGTVRVDFCQPFSLKEFLLAAEYSYNSPAQTLQTSLLQQNMCFFSNSTKVRRRSEYGTEIVSEDHRQLIKDLADYVVYDAFNAYSLMSTNILAFLFLTKHRKGATLHQLVSSLNWLRAEITKRNKSISFFGDSADLIKRASVLLGKTLVNIETIQMEWSSGRSDNNMKIFFYKPAMSLPEILELQYYSNAVLPVFLLESVIVNATCSLTVDPSEKNKENELQVHRAEILQQSLELTSMLQYEFIFSPPGTSLCTVLNATIDDLIRNECLQLEEDVAEAIFLEGNEIELNQEIKLSTEKDSRSRLQFLRCILSPFVESYYLAACSLPKLINSEMEESLFLQEMIRLGKKNIQLGYISHEECLGLDTLRNALKLFESWKIIAIKSPGLPKKYLLEPRYNNEKSLQDIISRIAKYKM